MSGDTRDVLTVVCLVVLGLAAFWLWKGAEDAEWVFASVAGADRSIRNRITRGKRCLIFSALSFFLCIQGLVDLTPGLRAFFFVAACVFMMWGGFFVWRGYRLWKVGIQQWIER